MLYADPVTRNAQHDTSELVSLDLTAPATASRKPLFGLDAEALAARLEEMGQPAWRGQQLAHAIYRQWVAEIVEISTLPRSLRQALESNGWAIDRPAIAQVFRSVDGTERYLIQSQNGNAGQPSETVETVWMPDGDGGEAGDEPDGPEGSSGEASSIAAPARHSAEFFVTKKMSRRSPAPATPGDLPARPRKSWTRATICVSSQVGCAVNCQFCLTAKLGLQRNLTAGEIAGQVVTVLARQGVELGKDRINLVFMGMGEPFLNYDQFMGAVHLLVREVGLSPQRMTVSTSGIVPGIERFVQEPPEVRPKLAISLNAPNDEVRAAIMPINRKWPIQAIMDAVRPMRLRSRERITFEYVLLGGVTDRPEHAREVARLVRRSGLPAKVNLIAWNPGPGIDYAMPSPESVEIFQDILAVAGIPVYLRQPRGRDIYAACGQLKRTVEQD